MNNGYTEQIRDRIINTPEGNDGSYKTYEWDKTKIEVLKSYSILLARSFSYYHLQFFIDFWNILEYNI